MNRGLGGGSYISLANFKAPETEIMQNNAFLFVLESAYQDQVC